MTVRIVPASFALGVNTSRCQYTRSPTLKGIISPKLLVVGSGYITYRNEDSTGSVALWMGETRWRRQIVAFKLIYVISEEGNIRTIRNVTFKMEHRGGGHSSR